MVVETKTFRRDRLDLRAAFLDKSVLVLGAVAFVSGLACWWYKGMDAVLESKLRIPADISVVGCDNTVYSSFRSISLTTIDHYVPLKGRDACDIILRKIQSLRESQDGNEPLSTYHVEYEPKLIVRRSTSYARTEKLKNK